MEQQGHLKNKKNRKKTQRYDSSGAIRKHRKVQTAEYACLLIKRGQPMYAYVDNVTAFKRVHMK